VNHTHTPRLRHFVCLTHDRLRVGGEYPKPRDNGAAVAGRFDILLHQSGISVAVCHGVNHVEITPFEPFKGIEVYRVHREIYLRRDIRRQKHVWGDGIDQSAHPRHKRGHKRPAVHDKILPVCGVGVIGYFELCILRIRLFEAVYRCRIVTEIVPAGAFAVADIIQLKAVDIVVFEDIAVVLRKRITYLRQSGVEVCHAGRFALVKIQSFVGNRHPFRMQPRKAFFEVFGTRAPGIEYRHPHMEFHAVFMAGIDIGFQHVKAAEDRVLRKLAPFGR